MWRGYVRAHTHTCFVFSDHTRAHVHSTRIPTHAPEDVELGTHAQRGPDLGIGAGRGGVGVRISEPVSI